MINNILLLIAGFGVFMFGIETFSGNIQKIGGNNMRKKINQFSKNRFSAIGFGFTFTTLFQSSTAGIIMVAGFTSAGIVTLFQGIALAIGSNIASAIPSFLISFTAFHITNFFCALAGIAIFILLFAKKAVVKNSATALMGFSVMFIGLYLIGQGTSIFSSNASIVGFFATLNNPILLILFGTAFTCLTQSSLATVAIVMTLAGTSAVTGVISIESAACLIYGANIGTAIVTAVMISLSSNIDGKRIGVYHILYSILGAIIFGLLTLTPWIEVCFSWIAEPAFKIAFINLIFNVVVAIIVTPLIKQSEFIMRKIMPAKSNNKNPLEVEDRSNESPSITLAKANEKIILFYNSIISLYKRTISYIYETDNVNYKKLFEDLSEYDIYINKFNIYVVRIATNDSYESVNKEIESLLNSIKQIERITRNCLKILPILKNENKKITYSLKLKKFIEKIEQNTSTMFDLTRQFLQNSDCKFLENENPSSYENILKLSHDNSEIKLSAKTYVIENGFNTKTSTEKNTSYIELMSYLGLISNNILDIVFTIIGQANGSLNPKYEQLILEGVCPEDKE